MPISVLGLGWFVVLGILALPAVSPRRREPRWLRTVTFAWAGLALAYVLYLVFLEVVVIHRICEWCTAVHVLVLLSFLVSMRRLQNAAGDAALG
jgi:uncharacterized membrane protein